MKNLDKKTKNFVKVYKEIADITPKLTIIVTLIMAKALRDY